MARNREKAFLPRDSMTSYNEVQVWKKKFTHSLHSLIF